MYSDKSQQQHHERKEIDILQAYFRSQAELQGTHHKTDCFFDEDREQLVDDGHHPLLAEPMEPNYSQTVLKRSFATWKTLLDQNFSYKLICNYYHTLEMMGKDAPPHVQEYVRKSLVTSENIEEIYQFARTRQAERQLVNHEQQTTNAQYYRNYPNYEPLPPYDNPRVLNNLEIIRQLTSSISNSVHRSDRSIDGYQAVMLEPKTANNSAQTSAFSNNFTAPNQNQTGNYDAYSRLCDTLAAQFYRSSGTGSSEYTGTVQNPVKADIMCQSQTSIDSSPSKESEADSCYLSMTSPGTETEE